MSLEQHVITQILTRYTQNVSHVHCYWHTLNLTEIKLRIFNGWHCPAHKLLDIAALYPFCCTVLKLLYETLMAISSKSTVLFYCQSINTQHLRYLYLRLSGFMDSYWLELSCLNSNQQMNQNVYSNRCAVFNVHRITHIASVAPLP